MRVLAVLEPDQSVRHHLEVEEEGPGKTSLRASRHRAAFSVN